ncbi:heme peroxidase [Diplocarpon rosae]|nr:heme peroxidase [Diplocarpon rosae]
MAPNHYASSLFFLFAFSSFVYADIPGIERRESIAELEHLLVDNGGFNAAPFFAAVSPCSNYVGFAEGRQNQGEQTSAQWVRFAFHDFVTADISAGTGGIDASLGFESEREENMGLFVEDTMEFLATSVSAYLSTADHVPLAVLLAIASCGAHPEAIPLRVGRIDATQAGPAGVPGPLDALEPTLARFAKAGFAANETIALTACGHSLGRVHHSNFPEIVDASAVSATNLNGGVAFDSSPAAVDPNVMNEYLTGTNGRGGPLVTSPNIAARSDLRLFSSDGNATIQTLSQTFAQTCSALFEKMLNTVPKTVSLSDPVAPQTWKATNVIYDISDDGGVRIEGLFRYLQTGDVAAPETVSYVTISSKPSATQASNKVVGTGTSLFGNTTYWDFEGAIESPGTTSLSFQGVDYPLNDEIFILATQSSVDGNLVRIKAAAATIITGGLGPATATLYVPVAQQGSKAMRISPVTVPLMQFGTAGKYTLYQGMAMVENTDNVIAKVVLGDKESQTVKTSLFNSDCAN